MTQKANLPAYFPRFFLCCQVLIEAVNTNFISPLDLTRRGNWTQPLPTMSRTIEPLDHAPVKSNSGKITGYGHFEL